MKRILDESRKFIHSKKGSAAVLLCILFSALVLAASVIIDCAGWEVSKAYGERVTFLACRSVLAQYDMNLWEDYGLLAYSGTGEDAEKEIQFYLEQMGRKKPAREGGSHLMFDIVPKKVEVNTAGGTLINLELVKEQIVALMKLRTLAEGTLTAAGLSEAADVLRKKQGEAEQGLREEAAIKEAAREESEGGEDGDGSGSSVEIPERETVFFSSNTSFQPGESPKGERVLQNNRIISGLPSKGYEREISLPNLSMRSEEEMMELGKEAGSLLDSLSQGAGSLLDRYLIDRYILTYMNCAMHEGEKETFFGNEVEYILCGSYSDRENYQSIQLRLFLLRTGLNLAHIYSDPEKRNLTLEAAAAMSGPFAAAPVQFLICISWASFEAKNDLKVLMEGGKIPLIKESGDWALSLDALFGRSSEAVGGAGDSGLDYQGYLQIFLTIQREDEKLLRCMDLIQINMKGRYRDSFDLRACISRFEAAAELDRKQYTIRPGISLIRGDTFTIQGVHSYD